MRERIESKIEDIVNAIIAKDSSSVTKDEYDILSSELHRIIYEEDMKEKNKKLAETMGAVLGTTFGSSY